MILIASLWRCTAKGENGESAGCFDEVAFVVLTPRSMMKFWMEPL
jgi:hypothetical protein